MIALITVESMANMKVASAYSNVLLSTVIS